MRKITAILLVLLLFFNWYGYQFVISHLKKTADQKLESNIDQNNYDESQLIEIRVALNMPYQERYTEFERHYGEINIDGKVYSYVKRKIQGDVLILKCIPNESKQLLKNASDDLVKSNSGQDKENSGKKQSSLKIFSSDYEDKNQFCNISLHLLSTNDKNIDYTSALNEVLIKTPHQPPRS